MTDRTLVDEAADPETPFHRLLQLYQIDDVKVRRALVDNPSIAVDENGAVTNVILLKLANEFPDEVAACSAFALFAIELKEEVMLGVAQVLAEEAKDPGVLTILLNEFGHDYYSARWRIARNKNTPPGALRFLADNKTELEAGVRRGVACNPNTPVDVLRFLADKNNESDAYVRVGVADNLSAPEDLLRFMVDHDDGHNDYVRRYATQVLKNRGLR